MSDADLVIALRAYPGLSKRPAFFTEKLTLWEASVRSLAGALEGVRAHIHALLDDCPDSFETVLRRHLSRCELTVHRLPKSGNRATWAMQLDILSTLPSGTPVYLAEDDYLYTPGAFAKSLAFAHAHKDVAFISLFDHPGWYYAPDVDPVDRHALRWHGDRHWRTAVCTTCSFQSRADVLRRARRALDTYTLGSFDMSMWMLITRRFLLTPGFVARLPHEPFMKQIWLGAWKEAPRILPRVPRMSLWAPMPALATHLEGTDLAHGVDWSIEATRGSSCIHPDGPASM